MKILVIGESCTDIYQYGDCTRLCPEAPVPVFKASSEKTTNPGMAMNVWRNINSMSDCRCDIETNQNWQAITKTRCVDTRTNYVIVRIDVMDDDYSRCDVNSLKLSEYDVVVISDYDKGYLTEQDIHQIGFESKVTFLDTKKILGDWCNTISFIKINEFEYEKTKHKLNDELNEKMIITLGPNGAMHRGIIYPVPKVEIKDTSGAGDTFVASLAATYAQTKNIEESIRQANVNATMVVQRKGVSVV